MNNMFKITCLNRQGCLKSGGENVIFGLIPELSVAVGRDMLIKTGPQFSLNTITGCLGQFANTGGSTSEMEFYFV